MRRPPHVRRCVPHDLNDAKTSNDAEDANQPGNQNASHDEYVWTQSRNGFTLQITKQNGQPHTAILIGPDGATAYCRQWPTFQDMQPCSRAARLNTNAVLASHNRQATQPTGVC